MEDVNKQLDASLGVLLGEVGEADVNERTRRILRMAWLDGYKQGMDAVGRMAEQAFERVAEQVQS